MSSTTTTTSSSSLKGKVALITGASSGIGAATAKIFAASGARLVLHGRDGNKLQKVIDEIKSIHPKAEIVSLSGDIALESVNKQLVELAIKTYGSLHIAFNNAGVFVMSKLTEITEELIDSHYNTNVKGVLFGLKYQLPAIGASSSEQDWGVIINNSSTVAERIKSGSEGNTVYASTKAALDLITKYAALEGAPLHVRVNSVNPGMTASEGAVKIFGNEDGHKQATKQTSLTSIGATSSEIGEFVKFIAQNDTGRFFNGSNLLIDGGYNVK